MLYILDILKFYMISGQSCTNKNSKWHQTALKTLELGMNVDGWPPDRTPRKIIYLQNILCATCKKKTQDAQNKIITKTRAIKYILNATVVKSYHVLKFRRLCKQHLSKSMLRIVWVSELSIVPLFLVDYSNLCHSNLDKQSLVDIALYKFILCLRGIDLSRIMLLPKNRQPILTELISIQKILIPNLKFREWKQVKCTLCFWILIPYHWCLGSNFLSFFRRLCYGKC